MQKILITGASGFLGTKLYTQLLPKYDVVGSYSSHPREKLIHLDVSDRESVLKIMEDLHPEIIIHTAGAPDPDYCEEHPVETEKVHFVGAKNIVEASKKVGAKLIYISTTYVFGGDTAPYSETDPTSPVNLYGAAKARAENEVQILDNSAILRFDFLYGYNEPNSPNGLVGKILSGRRIEANSKQQRKPLLVDDVARTAERIIETNGSGIYHLAGPDNITKYELCKRLEQILGLTGDIHPIEFEQQVAKRPKDSSLSINRLAELGISCTPIEPALNIIREQFASYNKEGGRRSIE